MKKIMEKLIKKHTVFLPIKSLVIPRLVMSIIELDAPIITETTNIPHCLKPSLVPK